MKNKLSLFFWLAIFALGICFSFEAKANMTFSDIGVGATTDEGATVTDPTVFNLETPVSTRYLRIEARNDGSLESSNYIELRSVKAWAGGSTNVLKSIHSGGNARVVEYNVYNGAVIYNGDLSADCSASWRSQGSLCDEGPTADSKTVSSKSVSASGATWSASGADDTGVLVVDMGSVQNLTELRVFQMFSDGKTTQVHFAYHPENGDTPPGWNDSGWLNFDGTSAYLEGELGSPGNPYQIRTCAELQEMNNDPDAYYVLKNDIDCSGIPNFVPIGNTEAPFAGILNGDNHDISNLTIDRPEDDYVGLFGYIYDYNKEITIRKVNLKNVNIVGKDRVGGLVGYFQNSNPIVSDSSVSGSVSGRTKVGGLIGSAPSMITISNSSNSASVSADYTGATSQNGVGGIVGVASSATFNNSYNTGSVSAIGTLYLGGLIGSANNLAISQSYNSGNITGNSATHTVGGLAGAATGLAAMAPMILDSYNAGNVSGHQRVGGLIGFTPEVSILNSYNSGSVTATYLSGASDTGGDGAGGLVGINSMDGLSGPFPATNNALQISNSFNVGIVSAPKNVGGLLGFADTIDGDHITWGGNGWDRPAKTIELLNNFYYTSSESLNCNDQIEASGCDVKDSAAYFKNTASVAPFVGGDISWDFEEVWQKNSDNYPTLRFHSPGEPVNVGPTAEKFQADIQDGFITVDGNNPSATTAVTFAEDYTIIVGEENDPEAKVVLPAGTVMTKKGGGELDFTAMDFEDITTALKGATTSNIAGAVSLGIPGLNLSFSPAITITINVGSAYDGQTLDIYFQNNGQSDWTGGLSCLVGQVDTGLCTFQTDHATKYSAGDKPDGTIEEEAQKAHVDSWKAYQYTDNSKCAARLKVEIKGKHFAKNAEVKLGKKEASSVKRKNSKNLTATFCLTKLMDDKTDHKKTLTVTNPKADTEKADKKINLMEVGYKLNLEDFNTETFEGVRNIQKALSQSGYLDSQYITGIYGDITTQAVEKFQGDNGIWQTGMVGPLTKAKLAEKAK